MATTAPMTWEAFAARGNELMVEENYEQAKASFDRGIHDLESAISETPARSEPSSSPFPASSPLAAAVAALKESDPNHALLVALAKLCCARSHACAKMAAADSVAASSSSRPQLEECAVSDAHKAVYLQPNWELAHFRHGSALFQHGAFKKAHAAFLAGLQIVEAAAEPGAGEAAGGASQAAEAARRYRMWIRKCEAETDDADVVVPAPAAASAPAAAAGPSAQLAAALVALSRGQRPPYSYYQMTNTMVVQLSVPSAVAALSADSLGLASHFEDERATLTVRVPASMLGSESSNVVELTLFDQRLQGRIVPAKCKFKVDAAASGSPGSALAQTKVTLKLWKVPPADGRAATDHDWHQLEWRSPTTAVGVPSRPKPATPLTTDGFDATVLVRDTPAGDAPAPAPQQQPRVAPVAAAAPAAAAAAVPVPQRSDRTRPYSSQRDWEAIGRNIEGEIANEKLEGEEALNDLFRSIYRNADEDTRRAMVKSFQTSGGTSLSTNWGEVGTRDYEKERTAPKGVEWRNWEGERVTQREERDDDYVPRK